MSMPTPPAMTAAPVRGLVQRTFTDACALSGFMDENHFSLFAGEYLATLDDPGKQAELSKAAAARAAVPALSAVQLDAAVLADLADPYLDALVKLPTFIDAFGQKPHRFATIDPRLLVALQVYVTPRQDPIPTDPAALLCFMLPDTFEVPAEVSLIPPIGPIQIVTSSPHFAGLRARLEKDRGQIIIEPPPHLNLVQVAHFGGRYYLRNGYHRVFDAIRAGAHSIPAIVIEALQPADVELNIGNDAFNLGYTIGLARPPLVADFGTAAAHVTRVRVRRFGVSIALQISPLNIGI